MNPRVIRLPMSARQEWIDRLNAHASIIQRAQFARWTAVFTLGAVVAATINFLFLDRWDFIQENYPRFATLMGLTLVYFWTVAGWIHLAGLRETRASLLIPESIWRTVGRYKLRLLFLSQLILTIAALAGTAGSQWSYVAFFKALVLLLLADALVLFWDWPQAKGRRTAVRSITIAFRLAVAGIVTGYVYRFAIGEVTNEERLRFVWPALALLVLLIALIGLIEGIRREPLGSIRKLRAELAHGRATIHQVSRRYEDICREHTHVPSSEALDS